jgi:hypothetical protein
MGCTDSRIRTVDEFWQELPIRKKKLEDVAKLFINDDELNKLSLIKNSKYWQFLIHPAFELESNHLFEQLFTKCKMRASYFFAVTSLLATFYSGKEIATHFSIIDLKFPELEIHEGKLTNVLMNYPEILNLYVELISSMSVPILLPIAERKNIFENYSRYYNKEIISIYSKRITDMMEKEIEKFWQDHYIMIQDDVYIREELKKISEECKK